MARHRGRVVLLLAMAAFFATMVSRLVISPLVPELIDAFSVSEGDIGIALGGMWATYAVMQFPGSLLADRYGERRVILTALALTGLGSLLVSQTSTYWTFLLSVTIVGAGAGLYFPVATTLLSKWFENRGRALGFHIAGGDLGGLAAPLGASALAGAYGWRAGILFGAIVVVPVFVACSWGLPSPGRTPTGEDHAVGNRFPKDGVRNGPNPPPTAEGAHPVTAKLRLLVPVITRPTIAYSIFLAVVLSFAFQALVSFFPTFLVEYHGVPLAEASTAFSALFVILVISMPVAGALSDALGQDLVLVVNHLCLVAGMVVLLVGSRALVPVGVALIGLGMGWGGVIGARFMSNLEPREQTASYGLIALVYVLLASTGSPVTGLLVDVGGWALAFWFLTGVLSLGLLALVVNHVAGLEL